MKYNYAVKYKGVFYPTGADVPVEEPDVSKEDSDDEVDGTIKSVDGNSDLDLANNKLETDNEASEKVDSNEEPKIYKKGDFTTSSKLEIAELAESLGYKITSDKKAEMIDEFLEQQGQKLGK